MQRVAVYIDGFNLYYGMRAERWQRYYWIDLTLLAEQKRITRVLDQHLDLAQIDEAKQAAETQLEAIHTMPAAYLCQALAGEL